MKYLITGGCGFLGSNLAEKVIKNKQQLLIFDNLSRLGSRQNLTWLQSTGKLTFVQGEIQSQLLTETIKDYQPDIIFHLAGQVAMTISIANPRLDFETNALGSLNLLEAVRLYCPQVSIVYSSTNKVYGDLPQLQYTETRLRYEAQAFPQGFDESLGLNFQSPYGCSKGVADQYMLDYARLYGLNTVVFRHSSICGYRQFSTFDQGWVGWFVKQAYETDKNPQRESFTVSGNGKQVRDVLFSEDLVNCYFSVIENMPVCRGHVFNIGGGYENSLSILELFEWLEQAFNVKLIYNLLPERQSDQKVFIANTRKALNYFSWRPHISIDVGLQSMKHWISEYV